MNPSSRDVAKVVQGQLSLHLRPLCEAELVFGNTVLFIEPDPVWIFFKEPIHRAEIERSLRVDPPVSWKVFEDSHYDPRGEGYYYCEQTRQGISGPLTLIPRA